MKEKILKEIQNYETIIIHRHVRPDPDALGSQGGLGKIIQASFPEKNVYLVGEEDESLTFLVEMDHIADSAYDGALVIICDTANVPRISDDRYTLGDKLIKIDHHPNEDPYGDIMWVDPTASSVSEMIMEFYEFGKDKGLVLSDDASRLLYAGIVGDTGRFLYSNTSERTFQYAGKLIQKNFSPQAIYDNMYEVRENVVRLNGYVLQNFSIIDGCVGYIYLSKEILNEFNVTVSEASQLVNSFSNVAGLRAWVFFVEEPDQIRVRLRSKGPVVNKLAAKFNGGGHPLAAGATVHTMDETKQVLEELRMVCKEYYKQ
ncbi:DHH family phosphoesterase [Fictibacillus gelatini]|uniref:DHH family phosphoesterase n=1 Tax=Fictibacillus gelatini TaxID=225985 RepID=UPI00041FF9F3|nr:bifunctional oligoribonuclease/PAP phosphatase NrnA [Fictibacillus gelatini]